MLTAAKLRYLFPLLGTDQPTGVRFANERDAKAELVQRILFERMVPGVRGPIDTVNWRALQVPADAAGEALLSPVESALRPIASVRAVRSTPFARYMPDLASVLVRVRGDTKHYSIVHNREHDNVSWISGEQRRLAPEEDTLMLREGFLGAYPNMVFVIEAGQAGAFAAAITRLRSGRDYQRLVTRFGVPRTDERFWTVWDEINAHFRKSQPVDFGWLDLTRYDLAAQ